MSKWHKIKKAQKMGGQSSSKGMKRMMKKMQREGKMDFDEIQNVEEVIIRTAEKEIVIESPQVTRIDIPGQGEVFQVVGKGKGRSKTEEPIMIEGIQDSEEIQSSEYIEEEIKVAPEDAQLVAQQAGVSIEEAVAALKQTNGDLAKAILLLKQTKF